ncbi:hypothetical protein, partial [Acinetobacter baumannii]|uniref:hypothetical protein n=1 Tax=Acinetobacter baumannii TaxID=470 RepID=UPI001A7E48C5
MVTLGDALTATLSLDAVEASFVQAAELIRLIESSSVDRRGGASYTRSDLQLTTEDREQVIQSETVIRDETTYFRVPADQTGWMHLDLPRPALGALAALTVLYGADLTKPIT